MKIPFKFSVLIGEKMQEKDGNVFTVLLAGVALTGVLGYIMYQSLAGPITSMVNVNKRVVTTAALHTTGRQIVLNTLALPVSDLDCDTDGVIEPIRGESTTALSTTMTAPTDGGFLPTTIVEDVVDGWGNPLGYCTYDKGPFQGFATCAAATATGIGGDVDAISGVSDVTSGSYANQVSFAIISAGPDGVFSTDCNTGIPVAFTPAGDDMTLMYSYGELIASVEDLWAQGSGEPTGCTSEGDKCDDGSVFFGEENFGAGEEKVYIADVADVTLAWKTSSGADDIPDTTQGSDGRINSEAVSPISDFPAFEHCANATYHGYTDWYLFSTEEAQLFDPNSAAIQAGLVNDIAGALYWTSDEGNTSSGTSFKLTTDTTFLKPKTNTNSVRCVRRQASYSVPTGCNTAGELCDDGSVYYGDTSYSNGSERLYVSDVADVNLQWKTSTGTDDIPGATTNDGYVNLNTVSPLSSFPAIEYCADATFHGHADWYLPSQDEIDEGRTDFTAINTSLTNDLGTGTYWTSDEHSTANGSLGEWDTNSPSPGNAIKTASNPVRCVRRASAFDESVENTVSTVREVESTGSASFTAVVADDVIQSDRGVTLADETNVGDALCDTNNIGLLRYNTSGEIEVCDGGSFTSIAGGGASTAIPPDIAGCTNVNDVCTDGSVLFLERDYGYGTENVYIADTPDETSSAWASVSGNDDIKFDVWDGQGNVAQLNDITNFPAAEYCQNGTWHGHNDWYLPSQVELTGVFLSVAAVNGALTNDMTSGGYYVTSTEDSTARYVSVHAANAAYVNRTKTATDRIRCVRREPLLTASTVERIERDTGQAGLDCTNDAIGRIRVSYEQDGDSTNDEKDILQYCNGDHWVFVKAEGTPTYDGMTIVPESIDLVVNQPGATEAVSDWVTVEMRNLGPTSFDYWSTSNPDSTVLEIDDTDCDSVTLAVNDTCIIKFRAKTVAPRSEHFQVEFYGDNAGGKLLDVRVSADPLAICEPGMKGPGGYYAFCSARKIAITDKGRCNLDMTDPTCSTSTAADNARPLTFNDPSDWTAITGYDDYTASVDGLTTSELIYNSQTDNLYYPGIQECLFQTRENYGDFHVPSLMELEYMRPALTAARLNNTNATTTASHTVTQDPRDATHSDLMQSYNLSLTATKRGKRNLLCIRSYDPTTW